MGTDLLTRDLMLDAVPYSVVNILAVWEIWDPITSQTERLRVNKENVRGGRMRVIHEVPAPRELASMVRSFLYFQICYRVSELSQPFEVASNEPGSRDRSREVSWMDTQKIVYSRPDPTCWIDLNSSSMYYYSFCLFIYDSLVV